MCPKLEPYSQPHKADKEKVVAMRCKKVQKKLTGFLDGELSAKNASLIQEHLSGCEECSRRASEARKVMEWAGTWQEVDPSPLFLMRLKARIRSEAEPESRGVTLWSPFARRALAGVAAACVIFLAGYFAALVVVGSRDGEKLARTPEKLVSADLKDTAAVPDRAEAERLVLSVQRMKVVFGEKLSEGAYAQLNEVQRVLAVRGGMTVDELAVVDGLQKAELLIREGDHLKARQVLDGIEQEHPQHPLVPYVRIARVLATPQTAPGSDFLRRAYATLVRETVGDPGALYDEVTNMREQVTQLREYGWENIVKSADRLNPLNAWNFVEQRILGGEGQSE
jgi:predicted anti-sigma-YlaC factor YlaD